MGAQLVTAAQIKKLWAMSKEAGLSQEELYAFVEDTSGKKSMKELTKEEAIGVIDTLNKLLGNEQRVGMATKKQLWTIDQFRTRLGWDEKRMVAFSHKTTGIMSIRWLTSAAASNVIVGLIKVTHWQNRKGKANA